MHMKSTTTRMKTPGPWAGVFCWDLQKWSSWDHRCGNGFEGQTTMAAGNLLPTLTQGIDDAGHEINAHKHGHPASCPQAPRL